MSEAIEPNTSESAPTKQENNETATSQCVDLPENESDSETKPKIVHLTPDDISNVARESGAVKWFNVKAGYGFIKRETGEDIFIHQTAIINNNPTKSERSVREGEMVEFIVIRGVKGPEAAEVTGPELGPVQGSTFARNKGETRPIRNMRNINNRGSRPRFQTRVLPPPPPLQYKPRGPMVRDNYFPGPRRFNPRPVYDRPDYRDPMPHRNDYLPFRNERFSMPPETQYYRPDRYFVPRRNNMQGAYNSYQGRDRDRERDRDRDRDRDYNRRDNRDYDNDDQATRVTTRSPDRERERDRNGPPQSRVTVTGRGNRFRGNRRWSNNRRARSDGTQTRSNETQPGDPNGLPDNENNANVEEVTSSLAHVRISGDEVSDNSSSAQEVNHMYVKDEFSEKNKLDSNPSGVTGIEA